MRKLVTLRQIKNIRPHPNADKLRIANVDHWQVVIGLDDFSENDWIVFCEIDSLIPRTNFTEFLFKNSKQIIVLNDVEYVKLTTLKLRGELSQGLVLPITVLKNYDLTTFKFEAHSDLTNVIGVKLEERKWADESIIGKRPYWIRSTSLERIQNVQSIQMPVWISEKIDGETFICYWDANEQKYGVCSNEVELSLESDNKLVRYFDENLDKLMAAMNYWGNQSVALFGEYYKGEVYFFDCRNFRNEDMGLNPFTENDLPIVPHFVYTTDITIEELMALADGESYINEGKLREGIVIYNKATDTKIKAISPQYLLQ